ncbi:MAG: hypothetical protein ACLP8S_29440 [Solirubrobacteraceae bacterium]
MGLHPRFLEQPPVDGELPHAGVVGCCEFEVVVDRPALGVLGVQRLVDRDPEAPQDRPALQRPAAIAAREPRRLSESR